LHIFVQKGKRLMKVLICGKGGSGKSTVSVLIAKNLKKRGYKVLLVDADESNSGLHRLAGCSSPVILIDSLGGKKGAKDKMIQAFSKESAGMMLNQKWRIRDIPDDYLASADGISLLTVGKVHHLGEGCACMMGAVSKTFLSNLVVGNDEFVIADTEAGVEHFGRNVSQGCDMILDVVDPAFESFMLAEKIQEMCHDAKIPVFFVLNKVEEQVREAMFRHIPREKVIAEIPKDHDIFTDSLEGRELGKELPEINRACEFIESLKRKQ